ncbi:MAG TPA: transketolase, partial [Acidobacteriota bacterium]|nr:transketolase [Acidobacteriota bacterium]
IGDDLSLEEELVLAGPEKTDSGQTSISIAPLPPPSYGAQEKVATRQAFGTALQKLGEVNDQIVALDGDVKNSTYSEAFAKKFPARFLECYIAEQNMVGAAAGMAALGKIPFASTFACFLSRAYDFIRMAGISQVNIKLCGSHAGVSIGEDGPSQMGLEDLAMMRAVAGSTVLYPSDAVSAERAVELAAKTPGIVYIRTTRPKTPILYSAEESFEVGGCKVLRSSDNDQVTLVAAGITLHEALSAYDILSQENIRARVIDLYSVKPVDKATLTRAAKETGNLLIVEDHYPEGGLGEAVLSALRDTPCNFHHLAINELPRSGESKQLMKAFGISASNIVDRVKQIVSAG